MFHHQRREENKTALCRAVTSGEKELVENKWQVFCLFVFGKHLYDKPTMYWFQFRKHRKNK